MGAALAGALYGCPGTLDDPDRFRQPVTMCDPDASICDAGTSTVPMKVTTQEIITTIVTPKCSFNGCHGNSQTQGMLDMTGDAMMLEGKLVEVRSQTAICSGRTLVRPGDPEGSLIFIKLSDTATRCGTRMPQGPELSASEKALIRQWIIDLESP